MSSNAGLGYLPTAPYKAKTIAGAQKRVRELMRVQANTMRLLDQFAEDRLLFAKLASKEPLFFNPLVVIEAERRRDELLREKGLIK